MKKLFLLFLIAGSASAQSLPDSPKPKIIDTQFLIVYGALGTVKALDGMSTINGVRAGARELNPIFGSHPTPGRLVGVNLAYFGGEMALGYALKRFGAHHRWARGLWLIEPSFQIGDHIRCVRHNYRSPF